MVKLTVKYDKPMAVIENGTTTKGANLISLYCRTSLFTEFHFCLNL